MRIHIDNLSFEAILGILPQERRTPQRIIVDVEIDYDYRDNAFIDYADVCDLIRTHMQTKRFRLIEEALESLHTLLSSRYRAIKTLHIKISKPDILPDATVAVSLKR